MSVDFTTSRQRRINVFELQQAERGIDFAHLAVDARGDHGGFVDEAEIFRWLMR